MDRKQGMIHHEVLEADEDGHTPDKKIFHSSSPYEISYDSLEIVVKNDLKVCRYP